MPKIRIEVKKPQYLSSKETPKPAAQTAEGKPAGVPGFLKLLLFLSYILFGYALWIAVQLFIKK